MKKAVSILFLLCMTVPLLNAGELLGTYPPDNVRLADMTLSVGDELFSRQNTIVFELAEGAALENWVSIDLKTRCNANVFSREGVVSAVRFLHTPLGEVTYYGVPFFLVDPAENEHRDAIGLASSYLLQRTLPTRVTVPIGKKLESLFFLFSSYYTVDGTEYQWNILYSDGTSVDLPFRANIETMDWWHAHSRLWEDDVKCVLVPWTEGSKTNFRNMHARQWKNPHPDKEIVSVTFNSDVDKPMGYYIYAITGRQTEAK